MNEEVKYIIPLFINKCLDDIRDNYGMATRGDALYFLCDMYAKGVLAKRPAA